MQVRSALLVRESAIALFPAKTRSHTVDVSPSLISPQKGESHTVGVSPSHFSLQKSESHTVGASPLHFSKTRSLCRKEKAIAIKSIGDRTKTQGGLAIA